MIDSSGLDTSIFVPGMHLGGGLSQCQLSGRGSPKATIRMEWTISRFTLAQSSDRLHQKMCNNELHNKTTG